MSHGWDNGLCSCFGACGTCCLGWCCPCIIYGRTSYRLDHPNDRELTEYKCCNGNCMAYGALLVLAGIGAAVLQCVRRPNIRNTLSIEGNGCKDCMIGCCCHCCALIQEDRELKDYQDHKGVYAAMQPGAQGGMMYAPQDGAQGGMAYAPQEKYAPQQPYGAGAPGAPYHAA